MLQQWNLALAIQFIKKDILVGSFFIAISLSKVRKNLSQINETNKLSHIRCLSVKSPLLSPVWQPRKDVYEPNSPLHNHTKPAWNAFSPFSTSNHGFIYWKLSLNCKVLVNHQVILQIREELHDKVHFQMWRMCSKFMGLCFGRAGGSVCSVTNCNSLFWYRTSLCNTACSPSFIPICLLWNLNVFLHPLLKPQSLTHCPKDRQ